MSKFFFIIAIYVVINSCEHPPGATVKYSYSIKNNSSDTIFRVISEQYPDTTLPPLSQNWSYVYPDKNATIYFSDKLESYFASLPKDTLSIFFLSADTVAKYDWSIIQNNYNILKRVDIDLNYLFNNNKTIAYP